MATAEPTTETGTVSGSDTTTLKEASHMSKAQGQFTIIDYNDALTLTGYIGSNLAKTQMYNPDNGSYTPDWKTKNLVLTPSLYVIGTTADQIATANVTSVKWYVGDSNTAITAGTNYALSGAKSHILTVKANVMAELPGIDYRCVITYKDESTGLSLTHPLTISFSRVVNGSGKVNLPYKQFLGYRKGADGFPEVVPEEAIVVHRIYTRFMEGLTPGAIAKELTADGIPTPSRKQRWQTSTVESILQNEKYKGAALLQKCFTVDFLTKKRKVNEGEVPQYYVEHSHEPIITPEEFDKVQTELARRKQISRQYSGKSIFSSRIVCGDCGSYFGSKVWNSTSKYRRVIWQCNGKFKGEHKCETPHLDEETIKARFVTALNAIIESKDNILEDCRLMQATLTDCTGIDTEIESLLEEIEVVTELTKRCIAENSQTAQNQEEYTARYNGFVERYEKAKAQLEQLRATKTAREAQAEAIGAFMFEVQELDALTEFDEKLWLTVIDTVTVHADGRMTFRFQGGTEIET